MTKPDVSERMACRVLGQPRSTQGKTPKGRADEAALTADIVALATRYGRHGRRRTAAMPRAAGWAVNVTRVGCIRRRERLKAPSKRPRKGRLWPNDGSRVRLRPERPDHVRSHDFVEDRTHDGGRFRTLNVVDEFARACLEIRIDRKPRSTDVIGVLSDLFVLRGVPGHVRSDDGPEFIARAVREWIAAVGAGTAFIEPGSPRDGGGSGIDPGIDPPTTGCRESFNSKLRDEPPDGEVFHGLAEARIVTGSRRQHHDTRRPRSSLGRRPPAPTAALWPAAPSSTMAAKTTMHQIRPAPPNEGRPRAG